MLAFVALNKSQTEMEIIPEQSPVCDHASTGLIEQAIPKATAERRTSRIAIDIHTGASLQGDWEIITLLFGMQVTYCVGNRKATRAAHHINKSRAVNFKHNLSSLTKAYTTSNPTPLVKTNSTHDGKSEYG